MPYIGKTSKFLGYYIIECFQENNINLSKEQWLVLKKLNDKDGQVQNDLAFITNRSKTSLTRLINTMERKGLVYRVISEKDKRIKHIFLSKLGVSNYLESLPILKKIDKELQKNISKEDIENTIKVLNQVQQNINKKQY